MENGRTPYILPYSEVKTISSKFVNQTYKIAIALPENFDSTNEKYPVLFVLDEHWLFPLFTQIVRTLQIFGEAPPMLIVGIGYPTLEPGDLWALRMRDYTPTPDPEFVAGFEENFMLPLTPIPNPSGGGISFLQFIIQELMPMIETDFRGNDQDRAIVGWSFGGLFVLNALLWQPGIFQKMIAISPSLWWGNGVTFDREDDLSAKTTSLPVKLYLCVGDGEGDMMVGDANRLGRILAKRPYDSLEFSHAIMEGESHLSVVGQAFSKGFRAIYA